VWDAETYHIEAVSSNAAGAMRGKKSYLPPAKKKYFPKGSVVIIYHSGGVFNFHDQN